MCLCLCCPQLSVLLCSINGSIYGVACQVGIIECVCVCVCVLYSVASHAGRVCLAKLIFVYCVSLLIIV